MWLPQNPLNVQCLDTHHLHCQSQTRKEDCIQLTTTILLAPHPCSQPHSASPIYVTSSSAIQFACTSTHGSNPSKTLLEPHKGSNYPRHQISESGADSALEWSQTRSWACWKRSLYPLDAKTCPTDRVMRYVIVNQSQIISACFRADCSSIWISHIQWISCALFHINYQLACIQYSGCPDSCYKPFMSLMQWA